MNGVNQPNGSTVAAWSKKIKESRARNVHKVMEQDGTMQGKLDIPYNRFLERVDSEAFREALGMQKAFRFKMALQQILNADATVARGGSPRYISTILKREGITLQEAVEVYGRWMLARATQVAVYRAPQIMSDIADDASNRQVVCPRCDGLGTLDVDTSEDAPKRRKARLRTCPECQGNGTVTKSGDLESRRIVLEVAGLAGKRGPLVDARSVHLNGYGAVNVESLVKEMETADEVPMIAAPVDPEEAIIDAETVEEVPNGEDISR